MRFFSFADELSPSPEKLAKIGATVSLHLCMLMAPAIGRRSWGAGAGILSGVNERSLARWPHSLSRAD